MVARKSPHKLAAWPGSGDVTQNLGYESQAIKAALYIRVSTDRQVEEGDSLEEQESELKKYCEFRKFHIKNIYIERGKSGGNTKRPEYQKLIKEMQAKTINAVIVKKLDRLSRSLLDFEALMVMMQTHEVEFISIRESFDTTTAMGKAMLRIALVFAQLEREQTSERLRDVFSYRASQGMYNGGIRPYGYTSINKELVPYAKEKQVVEIMLKQFLNCKSTSDTSRFLNDNGYRGRQGQLWDKRRVQAILQNPIYTGKVKWENQLFQGLHPPIVSQKHFDLIQTLFNHPSVNQEGKKDALLKSLLYCGHCKEAMTPSFTTNRHKKTYYYYRCTSTLRADKKKSTCLLKYVTVPIADRAILDALLKLSEPNSFEAFELKVTQHNHAIEAKVATLKEEKSEVTLQANALKTRKDRFLDSLISSQFLSTERTTIQTRITELEAEEKQLKSQLYKLDFAITQQESERLEALNLKEFLILFKADIVTFTTKNLQEKIRCVIEMVIYQSDHLAITFKGFPWVIHHPIPQNPEPGISP